MGTRAIGIVVEGATGRLGVSQHLRSLMAIRAEGGLPLDGGDRLVPEPFLLGRNPTRLAALAAANGGLNWSTERDACLADPGIAIYFDASATGGRPERANAAIAAGKHVYLEKPIAETLPEALALARRAQRAGLEGVVVQDKLFLPGLRKLGKLYDADFFGRVLSVRLPPDGHPPGRAFRGSAGGCSTASYTRRNGRAGTIAGRPAAASSSICSPIGVIFSTACWGRSKRCRAAT